MSAGSSCVSSANARDELFSSALSSEWGETLGLGWKLWNKLALLQSGGWKCTQKQSPPSHLYKPSKSYESPQLEVFRAHDCQLHSLTGRKKKPWHFFLAKTSPSQLRKKKKKTVLQTHMDQWRGREQDRLFFCPGGRADGGGEECQHLCWGYFLFYSCFLRDVASLLPRVFPRGRAQLLI